MKFLEKWADRAYSETDFGRSIAISISGIAGLIIYLSYKDFIIALLSMVIIFPIIRIFATEIYKKIESRKEKKISIENAIYVFEQLSEDEIEVIKAFVKAGGSVLTWRQVNELPIKTVAIESMIQRELIWTSITADGMSETFVLDTNIFNTGVQKFKKPKKS